MLVFDVIEETRALLLTGAREERNKLATGLIGLAATPSFTYPLGSIDRGSKLSIDLEDMYVWSKSSQTATVDRAQFGSTLSDHSTGAVVYVNSKFSPWEIFKAINRELISLSSPINGLFRMATVEFTYNSVISGYDFPGTDILDVYQVRYATPGPAKEYPISQDWSFSRSMIDEFPSGQALFVRDAFPSQDVLVTAKFPFTQLAASTATDISTSGLPATAYDILSIGAAYRLTTPREIRRNFNETQGDTRRANEVPPGANLGGSRELGRLRQSRINEELARLNLLYPTLSPRPNFTLGMYR